HVRTFVLLEDLSGIAVFDRFATRERPPRGRRLPAPRPRRDGRPRCVPPVFGLCGGRRLHILPCTHVRTFVLLEDLSGIAVFDRFATRERPPRGRRLP
ncbi:hypothetical protein CTI14_61620, partial [Methylobacterium radiotolerans]